MGVSRLEGETGAAYRARLRTLATEGQANPQPVLREKRAEAPKDAAPPSGAAAPPLFTHDDWARAGAVRPTGASQFAFTGARAALAVFDAASGYSAGEGDLVRRGTTSEVVAKQDELLDGQRRRGRNMLRAAVVGGLTALGGASWLGMAKAVAWAGGAMGTGGATVMFGLAAGAAVWWGANYTAARATQNRLEASRGFG